MIGRRTRNVLRKKDMRCEIVNVIGDPLQMALYLQRRGAIVSLNFNGGEIILNSTMPSENAVEQKVTRRKPQVGNGPTSSTWLQQADGATADLSENAAPALDDQP